MVSLSGFAWLLAKSIVVAVLLQWWLLMAPYEEKVLGLVMAACFSVIEYVFTATTTEDEEGTVTFTPFQESRRSGHTTWAQFWANVWYIPLFFPRYRQLVPNTLLRIALSPLNLWALEIVEGYLLIFLLGRNVAWEYKGRSAYCHGNVKSDYWMLWIALGAAIEALYDPVSKASVNFFLFLEQYGLSLDIILFTFIMMTLLWHHHDIFNAWTQPDPVPSRKKTEQTPPAARKNPAQTPVRGEKTTPEARRSSRRGGHS